MKEEINKEKEKTEGQNDPRTQSELFSEKGGLQWSQEKKDKYKRKNDKRNEDGKG